jgi:hypothetical protein
LSDDFRTFSIDGFTKHRKKNNKGYCEQHFTDGLILISSSFIYAIPDDELPTTIFAVKIPF